MTTSLAPRVFRADDQVRFGDLARIGAPDLAVPGDPAVAGRGHADGFVLPGKAEGVAETVDAVALHQAHGAGEMIGPDRLGTVGRAGTFDGFGDLLNRLIPGDPAKFA